jgi:HEAT repeat protein
MRKLLRFAGVTLALLGLVFTAYGLNVLRPREVIYQGKSLSAWVEDLCGGSRETRARAVAAFRSMGPEALDPLVAMVGAKDSVITTGLAALAEKQSLIKWHPAPASERRNQAVKGFYALGPVADAAIPALAELLEDPEIAQTAVCALAEIGKAAVPTLAEALSCEDADVREKAALMLGTLRSDARAAVPALVRLLQTDQEEDVCVAAAVALARIHEETGLAVPALIKTLQRADATVREFSALALRSYGSQARSAVPALQAALDDEDERVRQAAAFALEKIAPKATVVAGVE